MRPVSLILAILLPGCLYESGAACDDPAFDPQYTPREYLTDGATAAAGDDGVLGVAECADLCAQLDLEGGWREVTGCSAVESGDTGDGMTVTCEGEWAKPCLGGRAPRGSAVVARGRQGTAPGRWLARMATMEAASVGAFRELARDLVRLGAPEVLVAEARRSAVDEVRHARVVARLARAAGAASVPTVRRSAAPTGADLDRVAAHNAAAGCVAETWSALVARHQALRAPVALRPAFARIAADEARHAELAWAIDRWARVAGADPVRLAAARRDMVVAVHAEARRRPPPGLGLPGPARASRLARALERELWAG